MSIEPKNLPWHANDIEPWCIEDTEGNHVAECTSPQIAAWIIQQANAFLTVCERAKEAGDAYEAAGPADPRPQPEGPDMRHPTRPMGRSFQVPGHPPELRERRTRPTPGVPSSATPGRGAGGTTRPYSATSGASASPWASSTAEGAA